MNIFAVNEDASDLTSKKFKHIISTKPMQHTGYICTNPETGERVIIDMSKVIWFSAE